MLNELFGFRWSVCVLRHARDLRYALHGNSVLGLLGYVTTSFARHGDPRPPWSLELKFNRNPSPLVLRSELFCDDGPTEALLERLAAIDARFRVRQRQEPVFMDVTRRKALPLHGTGEAGAPTFFDVMDRIFTGDANLEAA